MRIHEASGTSAPRARNWVVAAPGAPVDWDVIVSEDEDGVQSGWAFDEAKPFAAAPLPRRHCA